MGKSALETAKDQGYHQNQDREKKERRSGGLQGDPENPLFQGQMLPILIVKNDERHQRSQGREDR